MLAAIVLVWVGGPVPAHLAYTCASMGRQRKARLVVIYETSAAPLPWTCRRRRREGSVETHELCDGCVAALHARRLAPVAPVARDDDLGALFADVLALAPQVLAEFKPTWGVVFSDYLRSYTHWTYTDADVVFGSIDAWLDDDYSIDVETWSFEGDAGRVFLRGQWALHKNEGYVNELWRQCPHLSSRLVENLRYKLAFFRGEAFGGSKSRERLASDARRRLPPTPGCDAGLSKFVSAEGCYSCVVFRATNLSTRIVPNMLSDHSSQPVYWRRGSLARCRRDCAPPRPLVVRREPARFVQDCHDMNWICRSVPAAALHVVPNPRGPFDAVETTQRGGTAILVADHENKNTSRRHAPLFHFRKWADYGAFEVPTFPPARARSFEIHYDGIRNRESNHWSMTADPWGGDAPRVGRWWTAGSSHFAHDNPEIQRMSRILMKLVAVNCFDVIGAFAAFAVFELKTQPFRVAHPALVDAVVAAIVAVLLVRASTKAITTNDAQLFYSLTWLNVFHLACFVGAIYFLFVLAFYLRLVVLKGSHLLHATLSISYLILAAMLLICARRLKILHATRTATRIEDNATVIIEEDASS